MPLVFSDTDHTETCKQRSKRINKQIRDFLSNKGDEIHKTITSILGETISAEHPSGRTRSNRNGPTTAWFDTRQRVSRELMKPRDQRYTTDHQGNKIPFHIVTGNDVYPDNIGNIDKWVEHEGLCKDINKSTLRQPTFMASEDPTETPGACAQNRCVDRF